MHFFIDLPHNSVRVYRINSVIRCQLIFLMDYALDVVAVRSHPKKSSVSTEDSAVDYDALECSFTLVSQ